MSEYIALDRALDGEKNTVEGRLADIIENDDCIIRIDEYKLSFHDKKKVINALLLAHAVKQVVT